MNKNIRNVGNIGLLNTIVWRCLQCQGRPFSCEKKEQTNKIKEDLTFKGSHDKGR